MALKTKWQKFASATSARKYARWDWLFGYDSRHIQIRKAMYIMGYTVNYPFRKR